MSCIRGDQGKIDLASDVGEQVLPDHAEQRAKNDNQQHADTQRVQQLALAAHQDRIDQVLHKVRSSDAQQGHQQGASQSFDQHALVAS